MQDNHGDLDISSAGRELCTKRMRSVRGAIRAVFSLATLVAASGAMAQSCLTGCDGDGSINVYGYYTSWDWCSQIGSCWADSDPYTGWGADPADEGGTYPAMATLVSDPHHDCQDPINERVRAAQQFLLDMHITNNGQELTILLSDGGQDMYTLQVQTTGNTTTITTFVSTTCRQSTGVRGGT